MRGGMTTEYTDIRIRKYYKQPYTFYNLDEKKKFT